MKWLGLAQLTSGAIATSLRFVSRSRRRDAAEDAAQEMLIKAVTQLSAFADELRVGNFPAVLQPDRPD